MHQILAIVLALYSFTAVAAGDDAQRLVERADRSRGGFDHGLAFDIAVTTVKPNVPATTRAYTVKMRGESALATVTTKGSFTGDMVLITDKGAWFLGAHSSMPTSITRQQRLTSGMMSIGDVVSTAFGQTYAATTARSEALGGQTVNVIELKPKSSMATYSGITYYVDPAKQLGLKADYRGEGGKLIRSAVFSYGHSYKLGSDTIPFVDKIEISDLDLQGAHSTVTFTTPIEAELPVDFFQVAKVLERRGKAQL